LLGFSSKRTGPFVCVSHHGPVGNIRSLAELNVQGRCEMARFGQSLQGTVHIATGCRGHDKGARGKPRDYASLSGTTCRAASGTAPRNLSSVDPCHMNSHRDLALWPKMTCVTETSTCSTSLGNSAGSDETRDSVDLDAHTSFSKDDFVA
jgi:hypothetical protein